MLLLVFIFFDRPCFYIFHILHNTCFLFLTLLRQSKKNGSLFLLTLHCLNFFRTNFAPDAKEVALGFVASVKLTHCWAAILISSSVSIINFYFSNSKTDNNDFYFLLFTFKIIPHRVRFITIVYCLLPPVIYKVNYQRQEYNAIENIYYSPYLKIK